MKKVYYIAAQDEHGLWFGHAVIKKTEVEIERYVEETLQKRDDTKRVHAYEIKPGEIRPDFFTLAASAKLPF